MRFRALASTIFVTCSLAYLALSQSAKAETTIFDSLTGVEGSIGLIGPTTGRTFVGEGLNLADPGIPVQITEIDFFAVFPAATIGTTYQNLQARVQLWNASNNANSGSADVFSDPAGGVRTQDLGLFTVDTPPDGGGPNRRKEIRMTFAEPISLTGLTNIGITLNVLGDLGDGNGLQVTNNISIGIRGGPDPSVGSFSAFSDPALTGGVPYTGYYRNASNRTDFNFNGSDFRYLTFGTPPAPTPAGIGLRIFAVSPSLVPESSTLGLLALGSIAVVAIRYRRRA